MIATKAEAFFWTRNLRVLIKFFKKELNDDNVYLNMWDTSDGIMSCKHTCGSVGCVGGWTAVIPHFTEMGISRNKVGAPTFGKMEPDEIAELLFGKVELFSCRDDDEDDIVSDREIAIRRLKKHLKVLKNCIQK